jgi:hypothetical protein
MKIKNKNNILLLLLSLVLLSGCAVTDLDKQVNFSAYRTFAWTKSEVKVANPIYNSDLISKNIKRTVETEFEKRGIMKREDNPDFLVSFHTYTEQKQESNGGSFYNYSYMPFRYFYGYGFGFPFGMPLAYGSPSRTYTFTEGTLILDITDRKTNEVIWRGSVSGNVNNVATLQKQIGKGIKAIMKKFPITPGDRPLNLDNKINS